MDIEGGVTKALNIKRTKMGQGDKEWAYIITKDKAIKFLMTIVAIGIVLSYLVFSKEMDFIRQTKLTHQAAAAEHDSDVSLVSISAELEAHLATEAEWQREEQRIFEREKEMIERMRALLGQELAKLSHEHKNAVGGHKVLMNVQGPDKEAFLKLMIDHQSKTTEVLNKHMDKLSTDVEELAKTYSEKAEAKSKNARDRLHSLHKGLQKVISKVDKAEKDPDWSESEVDAELHMALQHFFQNADEFAKKSSIELPEKVEEQVKEFHTRFDMYNADEIVERVNKALQPEQTGGPLYGAWLFKGGSVEEYLDGLLFAAQFKRTGYPQVVRLKHEWETKQISNVELLNTLMDQIERTEEKPYNYLPPEWFMAGDH
jgi:ElaB/YqjD/DUF883 family membrane-anchored ribosome-binding protein